MGSGPGLPMIVGLDRGCCGYVLCWWKAVFHQHRTYPPALGVLCLTQSPSRSVSHTYIHSYIPMYIYSWGGKCEEENDTERFIECEYLLAFNCDVPFPPHINCTPLVIW